MFGCLELVILSGVSYDFVTVVWQLHFAAMYEWKNHLIIRKTGLVSLSNLHSNLMVDLTRISLQRSTTLVVQTLLKVLVKYNWRYSNIVMVCWYCILQLPSCLFHHLQLGCRYDWYFHYPCAIQVQYQILVFFIWLYSNSKCFDKNNSVLVCANFFLIKLVFINNLLWLQRIGLGQSFPWFLDSVLCTGVILHGICNSNPENNSLFFSVPGYQRRKLRMNFIYLVAGYYSYLSGLALAPYRVLYVMALIGVISFASRMLQKRFRDKGEVQFSSRKYSHRHWNRFTEPTFHSNLIKEGSSSSTRWFANEVGCDLDIIPTDFTLGLVNCETFFNLLLLIYEMGLLFSCCRKKKKKEEIFDMIFRGKERRRRKFLLHE